MMLRFQTRPVGILPAALCTLIGLCCLEAGCSVTPQPIPINKDGGLMGDIQNPPWHDCLPYRDIDVQRDKAMPLPYDGAGPDAAPSVPDLKIDAPSCLCDLLGEGAPGDGAGEGGPANDSLSTQEGLASDALAPEE